MKKFLSLALILCLALTSVATADVVRDDSLGKPILNVDDTAVLARYPAALQNFPSTIYVGFDGAADYTYFGLGYKANDMLAIASKYENTPSIDVQSFYNYNANTVNFNRNLARVADLVYGGKMGSMLFGASSRMYFYNGGLLKTTSIDSNEDAYNWVGVSGFKATLNPSVILGIGDLSIYGTLTSTLNFTKEYTIMSNKKDWYNYTSPALLQMIGFTAMASKSFGESTVLGSQLTFNLENTGRTFQSVTNGKDTYKTNVYQGQIVDAGLTIGSKIKATEAVTFFVDMTSKIKSTTGLHKKDAEKSTYNITTVWTVPSVTLGADFEILKNLNIRISAVPTYTVTYFGKASYKGAGNAGTTTATASAFDVASQIGLGWTVGAFKLNWQLDTAFLDNLLRNPLSHLDITGKNGETGGNDIATRVQANFAF